MIASRAHPDFALVKERRIACHESTDARGKYIRVVKGQRQLLFLVLLLCLLSGCASFGPSFGYRSGEGWFFKPLVFHDDEDNRSQVEKDLDDALRTERREDRKR
jgi:hypothetical protein